MKNIFTVTFKVEGETLPTLLSAIAPECQLVSVMPEATATEPPKFKKKRHHKGRGENGKGVQELILDELTKADINGRTHAQLQKVLKANGLSPKSASPRLSFLASEGRVKKSENGSWVKVR